MTLNDDVWIPTQLNPFAGRPLNRSAQTPGSASALQALAGRDLFLAQLGDCLEALRGEPRGRVFAVLVLDIDRFHMVADTLGFAAADELLSTITQRLTGTLRLSDRVAQVGDDEFAVLISGLAEAEHAPAVALRIQAAVQSVAQVQGSAFHVNASCGLAVANAGYLSAGKLLQDALAAAHQAHKERPGSMKLYTEQLHVQRSERLALDAELREAVLRGDIHAFYQPLVGLADGKPRGFEALARWRHPELGYISPAKFIPIAEEGGLIKTLGSLMLELSLQQVARWRQDLGGELFVSVNVSAQQLEDPAFAAEVISRLESHGLPASALHLEITESALVRHPEAARLSLNKLSELGIHISLDDFGTGYSAFSSLHQFPIHTLKIDRSLLPEKDGRSRQRQLFDALCVLARNLGLQVVVEGVESDEQAGLARSATSGLGQGYLWSRPMDPAAAADWLRAQRN
jgi:diguanylate cyclase (GGDEF)-like protein